MLSRIVTIVLLAVAGYQIYRLVSVRRQIQYNNLQADLALQSIAPIVPVDDSLVNLRTIEESDGRCALQFFLPPQKQLVVQRSMIEGNRIRSVETIAEIPAAKGERIGFVDIEKVTSEEGVESIQLIGLTERALVLPIPEDYKFEFMHHPLRASDHFDARNLSTISQSVHFYYAQERTVYLPTGYAMTLAYVRSELKDASRIGDFNFVVSIAYADAPVEASDEED